MADRAPFPTDREELKDDDRVLFDQITQTYKLEDERGEEWEWLEKPGKWVPVVRIPQNPVHAIDRLWPAYITVT